MSIRRVRVGSHVVAVTDTDDAGARTFVLVHGIGMGASYFAALSTALEPHGRVLAIDLPGFGEAPMPDTALTIAQMGTLLIDLAQLEGLERPILIGHSMGTQVIAEAAAQRPDLFDEIVLIAPTVNRHERTIGRQAWRMVQDIVGESPGVIAVGLQNYLKAGPRWFATKLHDMMDHHIEDVLPRVAADTLVLRGTRDHVCPRRWAQEVTGLLPHGRLVELPGRRHETMVKDGTLPAELIVAHLAVS